MVRERLSIKDFAKIPIIRQRESEADTFIIIYGARRTGKSTLGLKILKEYILYKKKLYAKIEEMQEQGMELSKKWQRYVQLYNWKPPARWKPLFEKHFATSTSEMAEQILKLPKGSFCFVDEGIDIASWQDMMKTEQKELMQNVLKAGERGLLTIFITPSLKLLRKEILAEAQYFIIIPRPHRRGVGEALVLRNYDNSILREYKPFGVADLINNLTKWKRISHERFIAKIKALPTYTGYFKYGRMDERVYELYRVMVKEPAMLLQKKETKYISKLKYDKILYALQTVLYNLYVRAGYSPKQIESLFIDKWGNKLWGISRIKTAIEKISTMAEEPDFTREDVDRELTKAMILEEVLKRVREDIKDVLIEDEEKE